MVAEIKSVYSQFKKEELISIAVELGLEVSDDVRSKELVSAIYKDIDTNGLPDTDDKSCSDAMFEFLVTAEYIDDNGNVLTEQKEDEEEEEVPEDRLPKCFTYADERDPSCQRCRVFDRCMKERIKLRPICYGKLYDSRDEQCKICLEALPCSLIVIKLSERKGN